MYEFTLGDIFWLNIEYEDIPDESKIRPAIIIDVRDNEVLLLVATTSVPPNNPPKYYDQFKIPILNWRKSGLPKPSWAQGLKLIHLNKSQLNELVNEDDYIGQMTELDFNYLVSEIERIHND